MPARRRQTRSDIAPFEGEGTILDTTLVDEIESSYLDYSYSVIYSRALPDARDGLKPVHRRILYAMSDAGLRPDRPYVKSARVVGDVMGRFHPHGDTAIYDAMVRLAQPFAMRTTLIDGHGNWGSPDDSAAASRYTECRLTAAALLLTDGLDEETVDLEPTYDDNETQPSVLPAAFPNLLVNGTSGIAVGMATNMIPHNLVEVVDAARHLLEHPDADLDELMRFVPGPDLPTGGQLLGMTEVRSAYENGRGVVRMRATAEVGALSRGKSSITVTELPYGVGAERVIAKVKELVQSKRLSGVAALNDFTDRSVGTQLVIEVKAGFNPQAVLAELYRLTPLEESFGINNVALVEGQPRTLGLKDLLQVFLDHRVDVVTRRTRYRLRKAQERAHLVEGLLIALDAIDEVVRIIRGSQDAAEARTELVAQIGLTDLQAGYVLDMQLRRLVALEVDKLRAELAELRRTIAELEGILADPVVLRGVIADELAAVAREHGSPRRTVLVGGDLKALVTARSPALEVADDPVDVLLSSAGLLARVPLAEVEARPSTKRHRHDVMVSGVRATARGEVGVVTSAGRVLRVGVLDLPEVPGVTTGALSLRGGAPASEFVTLERGERVLALTTYDPASTGLALATRLGVVKRVAPEWPAKLDAVEVIALRPGDEVVGAVELTDDEQELVLFTSSADLLRFPAAAVRPQGRSAGGMAGVKLVAGAVVVGFSAVMLSGGDTLFEEPVVVTGAGLPPERGKGPGTVSSVKVTPLSEYPRKGRATGGVRVQRLLSGEARLVLGWAGPSPAWAAAAGGDPVELPTEHGRRDGSGVPVDKPPVAVGRAHLG
ncbi:MAG TPA: DNA topoisomerase IV subunit A [Mycobacteriales bacterium]|jgi:DNA gyrase subunit A|nr:DNA topoisomerase IV subunit A [Mycobacteriales bacterium]